VPVLFVTERERRFPRRQAERHAGDILGGLGLDAGEGVAFGLDFVVPDGFAVNEQCVVRSPVAKESSQMATPRAAGKFDSVFV